MRGFFSFSLMPMPRLFLGAISLRLCFDAVAFSSFIIDFSFIASWIIFHFDLLMLIMLPLSKILHLHHFISNITSSFLDYAFLFLFFREIFSLFWLFLSPALIFRPFLSVLILCSYRFSSSLMISLRASLSFHYFLSNIDDYSFRFAISPVIFSADTFRHCLLHFSRIYDISFLYSLLSFLHFFFRFSLISLHYFHYDWCSRINITSR